MSHDQKKTRIIERVEHVRYKCLLVSESGVAAGIQTFESVFATILRRENGASRLGCIFLPHDPF